MSGSKNKFTPYKPPKLMPGEPPLKHHISGGAKNGVRQDELGVPQAEGPLGDITKKKILNPPKPFGPLYKSASKTNILREEQTTKCEMLMIRGIYSTTRIATLLGVSIATAEGYKSAVCRRWELYGSKRNVRRAKGEGVKRLLAIQEQLWRLIQGKPVANAPGTFIEPPEEVQLRAFKQLVEVHDRLLYLDGVSASEVAMLPETFASPEGSGLSVTEMKIEHSRKKMIAEKFLAFLDDQRETVAPAEGSSSENKKETPPEAPSGE